MWLNDVIFWLKMGFHHILDWQGYDHMLFLWMAFMGMRWFQFKEILWKISAFTLAHSLTLACVVFELLPNSISWVEPAIALSIALTAAWQWQKRIPQALDTTIILIFSFGLIHGLGFSGLLVSILGRSESVTVPLIGFNLGLEIGQILFVLILIFGNELLHHYKPTWVNWYKKGSLVLGFSVSALLFFERILGYIR
jgi:hypothetical protein